MKEVPETVLRALDDAIAQYKGAMVAALPMYNSITESPIEWALMVAFAGISSESDPVAVWPQQKVEGYRVDFLLSFQGLHLVVECDGHEFHERTKKQAAADRSRDRAMLEAGYEVMRFTGSEIYADARGCAQQAARHLVNRFYADLAKRQAGQ